MDEQAYLLKTTQDWIKELDASYVLRDRKIYYFGHESATARAKSWVRLELSRAVEIIKSRVSLSSMSKVTPDLIRAAFQEAERIYDEAIATTQPYKGNCLNMAKVHSNISDGYSAQYVAIESVLRVLELRKWGMKWGLFTTLLNDVMLMLNVPIITNAVLRNKIIRQAVESTCLEVRTGKDKVQDYARFRATGKDTRHGAIIVKNQPRLEMKWEYSPEELYAVETEATALCQSKL